MSVEETLKAWQEMGRGTRGVIMTVILLSETSLRVAVPRQRSRPQSDLVEGDVWDQGWTLRTDSDRWKHQRPVHLLLRAGRRRHRAQRPPSGVGGRVRQGANPLSRGGMARPERPRAPEAPPRPRGARAQLLRPAVPHLPARPRPRPPVGPQPRQVVREGRDEEVRQEVRDVYVHRVVQTPRAPRPGGEEAPEEVARGPGPRPPPPRSRRAGPWTPVALSAASPGRGGRGA